MWRKRADSPKVFSDFHIYSMALGTRTQSYTHTNKKKSKKYEKNPGENERAYRFG